MIYFIFLQLSRGGDGKVPLTPDYLGDGTVSDFCGGVHAYPPQ